MGILVQAKPAFLRTLILIVQIDALPWFASEPPGPRSKREKYY